MRAAVLLFTLVLACLYLSDAVSVSTTPYCCVGQLPLTASKTSFDGVDDSEVLMTLPFAWNGLAAGSQLRIRSNGWVAPVTGPSSGYDHDLNTVTNVFALYATDLDMRCTDDIIFYETLGTAPDRVLVVEYYQADHYQCSSGGANNNVLTGQLQFYEADQSVRFEIEHANAISFSVSQGYNFLGQIGIVYNQQNPPAQSNVCFSAFGSGSALTTVGIDTTVAVLPLTIATYQFTANDVTLTLNFGTALNRKVFVDNNGHTGCTVVIGANTELANGLEVYDSVGSGATNVVLRGNTAAAVSHIHAIGTGLTLQGHLDLTCRCDPNLCGIRGTMAHGDLVFDGVVMTDVSSASTTVVQVILATGNLLVTGGSSITVDAFLVATQQVDAILACSGSVVTATGSSSATISGYNWNGVSVGFATVAGGFNNPAVNHLDFNQCNFSGFSRGYFNYFNGQVQVPGSIRALGCNFNFGHKLRVRTNNDQPYIINLAGSVLTMSGSGQYLSLGDPRASTTSNGGSKSTVNIDNTVITSSGYFEVFGQTITGQGATVTATNAATIKVVPTLYHRYVCPIPGCDNGLYDSTAPTNMGGSYPYNAGDSNACRAWKLAATVCNSDPTQYFSTDDYSCASAGGFTGPFGTYCAVSDQYSCSSCPGFCNAGCAHNPLSLRDCAGNEQSQA